MQVRYSIGFGYGEGHDGKPVFPVHSGDEYQGARQAMVREIVGRLAAKYRLPGYFLSFGFGGWVNDQGRNVEEEGAVVQVYASEEDAVRVGVFAEAVRGAFSQQCVLLAREYVEVEMVARGA